MVNEPVEHEWTSAEGTRKGRLFIARDGSLKIEQMVKDTAWKHRMVILNSDEVEHLLEAARKAGWLGI